MRRIILAPVMGSLVLGIMALLFVQVPAGATGPTTVSDVATALCAGGGATVTLGGPITDASAVLTVAGGCIATLDLNGHTLTVSRVELGAGADLIIRDTSVSADGQLVAQGAVHNEAGIRTARATLRIESGTVSATGGGHGAGIGGRDATNHREGGTVTVTGGTVTARGGSSGAGIGGGNRGAGGTVTISGGTVTATGGSMSGAGIGGGDRGAGGTVTVSGGTVTATGGRFGAGIGGGPEGPGGTITVTGGTVTATGGENGAGIGGGQSGDGGTVTISGGTVTATSGFTSAFYGIGPGSGRTAGVVTIGPGLIRTDTEPTAGQRRTTVTPVPVPEPAPVPVIALSCAPSVPVVGAPVTCTVSGGDPGIDILWRAAYNPVIAERGVTLDANGSGVFSFVVPAAAVGEVITVELVEWLAPVSLGVVKGSVPASVPTGEGPVPLPMWPLVVVAIAGGLISRRVPGSGWPALRVS